TTAVPVRSAGPGRGAEGPRWGPARSASPGRGAQGPRWGPVRSASPGRGAGGARRGAAGARTLPLVVAVRGGVASRLSGAGVGRVGGASNLPPGALGALEIDRLLSESRPPLPARAVPLHGRWAAALSSSGPGTGIDLKGSGTLDGFSLQDGRRLADITILRRG